MVDIQSEEYKLGQNIRKYRLAKGWSQMDLISPSMRMVQRERWDLRH